ncbi:MAG: 50S ribosomal protein L6 [Firmicutes bacterium]|nr:50S ribosomal protein L6 [Bacillota bacterium]
MSRIGNKHIDIPAGVTIQIDEGNTVTVKGKLGTLTQTFKPQMKINVEGNVMTVERTDDTVESNALHGLTRTLLNNMVVGVTDGFKKELEIVGVGYRASKAGKTLTLNLGHSHPILIEEKDDITFEVPNANSIIVKGIDKQNVGQVAAQIRSKRPPEPYHGKGVKYIDEKIRRKAGKTGK